jgi:Bacterial DNA topoisomerase IB, N-terminal domain
MLDLSVVDRKDAAEYAGLSYVSDERPGIIRKRSGKGFRYEDPHGNKVDDKATLKRIKTLAIPPAWTDVCGLAAHSERPKMPKEEALALLLTDDDRSDAAADMGIDLPKSLGSFHRARPEVRHPPCQVLAEALHAGCDGPPQIWGRHRPDGRRQPSLRLLREHDADVGIRSSGATETEAQEVHLVRPAHGALLRVDLKPHARLQEPGDRDHDPLAGAQATHEHVTVVGIAHEPVTPPCQLLIQFVKDDIGQERRQRAALRFLPGRRSACRPASRPPPSASSAPTRPRDDPPASDRSGRGGADDGLDSKNWAKSARI